MQPDCRVQDAVVGLAGAAAAAASAATGPARAGGPFRGDTVAAAAGCLEQHGAGTSEGSGLASTPWAGHVSDTVSAQCIEYVMF
jgi:hypothetical protein